MDEKWRWLKVNQYTQIVNGDLQKRYRLEWDDDFIADFDHYPTVDEVLGPIEDYVDRILKER